jgi:hypothetical protein
LWTHGFRFSFTPLPGFFSPFPHGTGALSVAREYLALGGGPPGFPRNSAWTVVLGSGEPRGSCPSPTGLSPSLARLSSPLRLGRFFVTLWPHPGLALLRPATPREQRPGALALSGFGLFPVRSPLLGESRLLSFPRGTEMFQFPRFASSLRRILGVCPSGLPHSGIPGSSLAYSYPGLIAVRHALHRLLAPRHPPCALCNLTANLALWQDAFPRQYSLVKVLAQQGKWYFTRFPFLLQGVREKFCGTLPAETLSREKEEGTWPGNSTATSSSRD